MVYKFKKGDKVRLINKNGMGAEIGACATVTRGNHGVCWATEGIGIDVEWIRDEKCPSQGNGGYDAFKFEIIKPGKKVPKKELNAKKKKIFNEIKNNPDFLKCFSSLSAVKKEIESWNEDKILGW